MSTPTWAKVQQTFESGGLDEVFLRLLGWQSPSAQPLKALNIGNILWEVRVIAELPGAAILETKDLQTPSPKEHRKLAKQISRYYPEHIIRFLGTKSDLWYWPRRMPSGGMSLEAFPVIPGAVPDFLAQRLAGLLFSAKEHESGLTPARVRERLRGSVETAKITADFYKKFKTEHENLTASIIGLPVDIAHSYATLLLNRLMFIWFLQKKQFLNNDPSYLQTCLTKVQNLQGLGRFYGFYRSYLLDLFFNYLNSKDREGVDPETAQIVGEVPYINGGIFGKSQVELEYPDIQIPDQAFESIFRFFSSFTWHLDTRPTGDPKEINPEVIGYIFEQYINFTAKGKKEKGAYYTKPDVTGYIVHQTLGRKFVDILLDMGFLALHSTENEVLKSWIPQTLLHDCMLSACKGELHERLPGEGPEEFAWRVDWSHEIMRKLRRGGISPDDITSDNLQPIQIFISTVQGIDDVAILEALWQRLSALTVLDPACGSGAFLFSALEYFELAYSAIFETLVSLDKRRSSSVLRESDSHKNSRYFIRKNILLRNLYGVDLMADAVETAKLRLFLALASCLEEIGDLEPLPDLDFNIRVGNSLLGFAQPSDASRYADGDLLATTELQALEPLVKEFEALLRQFRNSSLENADSSKEKLLKVSAKLEVASSQILRECNFKFTQLNSEEFRPLHWFTTFPYAMSRGGFDVLVGNPPYIRRRDYTEAMKLQATGYRTELAPDIYAPFIERSIQLISPQGRIGLIVPISLAAGTKFASTRQAISQTYRSEWWSTFDQLPLGLFTPADVRNTILLLGPAEREPRQYVSQHHVFTGETRTWLFDRILYFEQKREMSAMPLRAGLAQNITSAIAGLRLKPAARSPRHLAYRPSANYWLPILPCVPPTFNLDGTIQANEDPRSEVLELFENEHPDVLLALAAGKIGFLWWQATGDGMDVYERDFEGLRAAAQLLATSEAVVDAAMNLSAAFDTATVLNPYRGTLYVNVRWPNLATLTDIFDQAALEYLGLSTEWPKLQIWYRQVMRSNDSRNKKAPPAIVQRAWSRIS